MTRGRALLGGNPSTVMVPVRKEAATLFVVAFITDLPVGLNAIYPAVKQYNSSKVLLRFKV